MLKSDKVYLDLRRDIIECRISPGSKITQTSLVSDGYTERGALRYALQRLTQEKLLEPVARQGYIVAPLTLSDASDIMYVRALLEADAAYLAAGKFRPGELAEVRRGFDEQYDTGSQDSISRFLQVNRDFKAAIATASGNAYLLEEILRLLDRFERYLRLVYSTIDRRQTIQHGSSDLIQALEVGDRERARKLMTEKMSETREMVVSVLISMPQVQTLALIKEVG